MIRRTCNMISGHTFTQRTIPQMVAHWLEDGAECRGYDELAILIRYSLTTGMVGCSLTDVASTNEQRMANGE